MRLLFKIIPIIAVVKVLFLVLWLGFKGSDAEMPKAAYAESAKAAEKVQKSEKKDEKKPEKKDDKKDDKAEKILPPASLVQPDAGTKESELLAAIEKRQKELDKREENIKAQEERLKTLRSDVEARINELNKVKTEAEKTLKAIEAVNKEEFAHIIKIYEAMPAEEAAARISKLEMDMAVKLLSNMKGKTAGKILSFVEPAKAAELTQGLGKVKKGQ